MVHNPTWLKLLRSPGEIGPCNSSILNCVVLLDVEPLDLGGDGGLLDEEHLPLRV